MTFSANLVIFGFMEVRHNKKSFKAADVSSFR